MQKQSLLIVLCGLLALGASTLALGQNGFYGGVAMRENGSEANGLTLGNVPVGNVPLAWNRFSAPIVDDTSQRSLLFGGYRWRNDLAVEAAVNTTDKYALHQGAQTPLIGPSPGLALTDASARSWNADVYTSWEVIRSLSLYGRLGYAQSDARQIFSGASLVPGDPRRPRDGVNYGLGLRYDVTHSLGLRVEYARFGRFAGEGVGSGLPDSDQVSVGVQFRF
ncbi:MAG TPA: outer membrane beta-barrel protein [Casimicrobiaceae bacterium]|nr:outer membrane beta-barrel protein [Casimicrobiaceae bacterium]